MVFLPSSTIQYSQYEPHEEWIPFIYYRESEVYVMASVLPNQVLQAWKKWKYILLCDGDAEAISTIVIEKIDIDTDD